MRRRPEENETDAAVFPSRRIRGRFSRRPVRFHYSISRPGLQVRVPAGAADQVSLRSPGAKSPLCPGAGHAVFRISCPMFSGAVVTASRMTDDSRPVFPSGRCAGCHVGRRKSGRTGSALVLPGCKIGGRNPSERETAVSPERIHASLAARAIACRFSSGMFGARSQPGARMNPP